VDATEAGKYVPQDWISWQQGNHDSQGDMKTGCSYKGGGQLGTRTTLSVQHKTLIAKTKSPAVATATVTPAAGGGTPTGSVSFFNGDVQIGSAPLNSGVATLDYDPSQLVGGAYAITAAYVPDPDYGTSTSLPEILTVQDFQITANPSTVTLTGQSGATTLTITPVAGFNQTLAYSCPDLPTGATCTFTPVSSTTESLTIHTTARSAGLDHRPYPGGPLYALLLPGVLGIALGTGNRKRGLKSLRLLGLIALLALCTLTLACSGMSSASNTTNPTNSNGGTKASVTVEASTGGANPVSHTLTLTLTQ
jgi:hypothetical protein